MTGPALAERVRLSRSELISQLTAIASGGWSARFQNDVAEGAAFIVGRALALTSERVDCVFSFERVPIAGITVLNPDRVSVTPTGGYPVLREALQSDPSYDSIPLSIGRSRRGTSVWDGHRRLETYRAAGRIDVPAWVATFRNGSGLMFVC